MTICRAGNVDEIYFIFLSRLHDPFCHVVALVALPVVLVHMPIFPCIIHASMPYSCPYINTYEHLLPNVPPSRINCDQLSLPLINHTCHRPTVLITNQQSLTMITSPYH